MKGLPRLDCLRRIFQRNRFERDMDEELDFHLESRIRDHIKTGKIVIGPVNK
jgi:hypothetical protein